MKRIIVALLIVSLCSINSFGYGPRGHGLVGAIADKRLAKNQAVAKKVRKLLDGMTLQRASTLPDEIKSWKCGRAPSGTNRINRELQAFVNANCSQPPNHGEFHYTDVPVTGDEEYDGGAVGRGEFDIVQMIPFCIRVLKGEVPANNERAITKSIAVILLTHYLGDIHQPLHVGAEFFDSHGKPFEPSATNVGFGDQGGNKLMLFTFVNGHLQSAGKLHSYWDTQAVQNAFGGQPDVTVVRRLSSKKPADWELNGGVETWAQQLANGILPTAREARERLQYKSIQLQSGKHEINSGRAEERRHAAGETFYAIWAADIVKDEIHKGGWRLAALLEEVVQ
ncbi:MAG TPA: S1/P1 nuclease [Pyrinomonadaceae bacterium]|nr:S1/P1 nuclease [Pyrinomonadaceae bacterium]